MRTFILYRTQFDGFTINRNPIKIRLFDDENSEDKPLLSVSLIEYTISWWNMARASKCNAIIVDNNHYLHCKAPTESEGNIVWNWYDNDGGFTRDYDDSCKSQLECSYQSNLESNFPLAIVGHSSNSAEWKEEIERGNALQMDERVFNHPLLTHLNAFMKNKTHNSHSSEAPLYVLRFGFNSANQVSYMTQLRIYKSKKDTFARDVYRMYNGRNSAWPAS